MCENLILFDDFDGPNEETKVFLNGIILGMTSNPHELIEELRKFRNVKMLPWDVSFSYNDTDEEIHICSDDGRLYRPVFTVKDDHLIATMEDGTNWDELVAKGMITYIDNMEANEAVIAFNENELVKYKNDYCEIAPAMMLGVMASIIPFPDHSQSPRNCYQCLDPETLVLMADNTKKAIKDIKIGDSVISVDPRSCIQSTTKVINQYVRETDKEIISIETESGRKITCTIDHPVLTTDGWKQAIDAENICVIPQQVVYSGGDEDLDISEMMKDDEYISELTSLGLYPVVRSKALPILARIVGKLIADEIFTKRQVKFFFNAPEDYEDFIKDLQELGFSYDSISFVHFAERVRICLFLNNAFDSLLKALTYNKDDWIIKNGSMLVKREYLSGGGSDFMEDNKVTGHQCLFEEFHIENQSEYFEKIGYRYDISKYVKNLRIYEYTKICQRSGQQFFWEREVRDRAIFVKIISKTKVKGNMIADITTESDNHSFIAGDSFCVHNSSMGKQAMSMFALSHLIRADTIVHVLNSPQKPLVSTKAATMMGFDNMPAGINCIVAIACYTGLTLVRPLPRRKTFGKFTSQ